MSDLILEIEALKAIYSEKELCIECKEDYYIINVHITKERKMELQNTNNEEVPSNSDEYVKFISTKLKFLLYKDYPVSSCPILEDVSVSLFDGKYICSSETALEDHGNNESNICDFYHIASDIYVNSSSLEYLNSISVYDYYDSIKDCYTGRVCLFDIIENIQSFIYELPNDNDENNICSELPSDNRQHEYEITESNSINSENGDTSDDEPITSGLVDRVLCSIDMRATTEEFNAWKERFRDEMIKKCIWKDRSNETALTGRQLFERDYSLVKSDENNSIIEIT